MKIKSKAGKKCGVLFAGKQWRLLFLVLLFPIVTISCGDDTPPDIDWWGYLEGPDEGIGWLSIYEPYGEYPDARVVTGDVSISMNGHTFIPPDASCSSYLGDFGSGYTVVWSNAANGSSGTVSRSLNCIIYVQANWSTDNGVVDNKIPLEPGVNIITVTSSDAYGNVGRGTVRIERFPVAVE